MEIKRVSIFDNTKGTRKEIFSSDVAFKKDHSSPPNSNPLLTALGPTLTALFLVPASRNTQILASPSHTDRIRHLQVVITPELHHYFWISTTATDFSTTLP